MNVHTDRARLFVTALLVSIPATVAAQQTPRRAPDTAAGAPWFSAIALGYGGLSVASDQSAAIEHGAFTLSLRGGRAINDRRRVGLDVAGWLIEARDVADGPGCTIGAGYEHRGTDRVRIAQSVQWSRGRFRDTNSMVLTRSGLEYHVWDVRVAALVRFGRRG